MRNFNIIHIIYLLNFHIKWIYETAMFGKRCQEMDMRIININTKKQEDIKSELRDIIYI